MIFINCEQGSPEWHAARCGVITASKYRDALEAKKDGSPTAKSTTYCMQVALERVSGEPCNEIFNSWQMKLGQEREPAARRRYEELTGNLVEESGVVLTDDKTFGYSTDGFVECPRSGDGLIEIKSLSSAEGIYDMLNTEDLSEYMHQIQGGMWITGYQWCDFVMYVPQLLPAGNDIFIKRVYRDEEFITKMESDILQFSLKVSAVEKVFREKILASLNSIQQYGVAA